MTTRRFLLNPDKFPDKMAQLDLPKEPKKLRQKLAALHEIVFSALAAEEENIIHAFEWSIGIDFDKAERIRQNPAFKLKEG